MKKVTLLWSVLFLVIINVQAEVSTIFEVTTYASLPAGWSGSAVVGNYFKLSPGDLITPTLDLSHYENITLTLDVATFGGTTNHPVSILVSNDNGTTWTAHEFASNIPTSSSYVEGGTFVLTQVSEMSKIKFECLYNNKGIRLKNLKLVGELDASAPHKPIFSNVLPADNETKKLGDSFDVSADVYVEGSTIDSVLLFYGEDVVDDSLLLFFESDSAYAFSFADGLDDDGSYMWFLKAFAHNGEVSQTPLYSLLAQCHDVNTPTVIPVSERGPDFFTANWLGSAEKYTLNIWSQSVVHEETTIINEAFATGKSQPDQWIFDGVGEYTSDASSGVAPPSLKFDTDGDTVIVDLGEDVASELSFWMKGNGVDPTSVLKVEGYTGTEWLVVDDISDMGAEATVVYNATTAVELPQGLQKFRFSYAKVEGNVAFDDVVIKSGGIIFTPFQTVEDLDGTSYLVTGLEEELDYYFSVVGFDQYGCASEASEPMSASYAEPTSMPSTKNKVTVELIQGGIAITVGGASVVEIYDISGRLVMMQKVNGRGHVALTRGLYLVRLGDAVTKVAVQ